MRKKTELDVLSKAARLAVLVLMKQRGLLEGKTGSQIAAALGHGVVKSTINNDLRHLPKIEAAVEEMLSRVKPDRAYSYYTLWSGAQTQICPVCVSKLNEEDVSYHEFSTHPGDLCCSFCNLTFATRQIESVTYNSTSRPVGDLSIDFAERMALHWGAQAKWVESHMRRLIRSLAKEFKPAFDRAKFDPKTNRLIGKGYCMQWIPRLNPDEPISGENQQTSIGIVRVYDLPIALKAIDNGPKSE